MTMTSMNLPLRRRPLAAGLAVVFATTFAFATASAAVPPAAETPTAIVTNCDDSGAGSLRDTLTAAANGDTIDLTQLSCSRITLTSGAIVFGQNDVSLVGPGRDRLVVDGANVGGVLYHLGFGTLRVRDVTIANGSKYRSTSDTHGGCIHSDGNVALTEVTVKTCSVTSPGPYSAAGGAIWAQERVYLDHSTVTGGFAATLGTARAYGPGVYGKAGVNAFYSIISDNQAFPPSSGGGIFTRGYLGVFESAIVGNYAQDMGGIGAVYPGSTFASIFNSTISGNDSQWIGGVYSRSPLYLYNSTIADNASYFANSGHVIGVGLHMGPALLTTQSSIIADNVSYVAGGYDLGGEQGVLITGEHNIIATTSLPPPPDTIWGPSLLAPLGDNGGVTPTHALMTGSFAVDFGSMPPLGIFQNDQRGTGFTRLAGGEVDTGAFESDPDRIFTTGFNFATRPPADPHPLAERVRGDSIAPHLHSG